jgi:hypothetical protein
MVTKQTFIAWSKALLHAIVIPAVLYGFVPFGWTLALAWLVWTAWLYATAFRNRAAAYPFALLAIGVALIVIPVLIGTIASNATRVAMGLIQ